MDFFRPLFILVLVRLMSADDPEDVTPESPVLASVGGWHPDIHEYTWAVGVHRKSRDTGLFEQICGGSLITQDLVISAAHCFWNYGNTILLEDYIISAGNFHRDMDVDYKTQKREIKRVILQDRYRDHDLNYASDIAIIQLKEDVILNDVVGTIDIDWSNSFEDTELQRKAGIVVGWGFTERDIPSEIRIAVNLPYVEFEDCYEAVPREFRSSLTPDKFCAGLRNGTAVCPGDSGGGLAFKDFPGNKWYLRGIVSVGVRPRDNSQCHKTQYTAFTSIRHYKTWIRQKLSELKSEKQRLKDSDDVEVYTFQ